MQTAIPCVLMRGGSSKGLYFLGKDLPGEEDLRNRVLLAAMGGGDPRQIDGLGGAHPLTSKIAIVSISDLPGVDVDYLFVQAVVGEDCVDTSPTCGNILAGVGPFALEKGLVDICGKITRVTVHMVNTGKICDLSVATPDGRVSYEGDAAIDGVPGTGSPIICDFPDAAGSSCGALLPTGNVRDRIDGIDVTCVDSGMPVVLLRAADFGLTGDEVPGELNRNETLKSRLNALRLKLGPMMNLGDVTDKVVPKMSLLSAPKGGGDISTRTFIPHICHEAIGVLGAASVAAGCIIPGSVCSDFSPIKSSGPETSVRPVTSVRPETSVRPVTSVRVEHPSGHFDVTMELEESGEIPLIKKIGLLRTARILMEGNVMIPGSLWSGSGQRKA